MKITSRFIFMNKQKSTHFALIVLVFLLFSHSALAQNKKNSTRNKTIARYKLKTEQIWKNNNISNNIQNFISSSNLPVQINPTGKINPIASLSTLNEKINSLIVFRKTQTDNAILDKIKDVKNNKINPPDTNRTETSLTLLSQKIRNETTLSPRELDELPPVKLKLLQALIFLEIKKNNPMALALLAELIDEPEVQTEATYQLALTAKQMGLHSEYSYQMQSLLNKEPFWQKKSSSSLIENVTNTELELSQKMASYADKFKFVIAQNNNSDSKSDQKELLQADQYLFNLAMIQQNDGQFDQANQILESINEQSTLHGIVLFTQGLILYRTGHINEAIQKQTEALSYFEKHDSEDPLKSISGLTLARLYFQQAQYQDAFSAFLKVDKKHPLWMQSMIEQAWAQILSHDYEGAAGNMFSLHTAFFKKLFAPESYVVRSVGYLNLCQYGDAARVIYDLKKRYSPILKDLQTYQKNNPNADSYYDTLKKWAQDPAQKKVDGIDSEIIYSMTKDPDFSRYQKQINTLEDEAQKLNQISLNLIKIERKTLALQNQVRTKLAPLQAQLQSAKSSAEKKRILEQSRDQTNILMSAKIQYYIAHKARTSIKKLREQALTRIDQQKSSIRVSAANSLKKYFTNNIIKLNETLDQSDILQYEIYSGAGEHLRHQMAGGEVSQEERPELKVKSDQALNWEFRGEIWEDEVGHYRSSLKNVCPLNNESEEKE